MHQRNQQIDSLAQDLGATKTPSTAENCSQKMNISYESHNQNLVDMGVSNFEANAGQSNMQGNKGFVNGRPYNGVKPP